MTTDTAAKVVRAMAQVVRERAAATGSGLLHEIAASGDEVADWLADAELCSEQTAVAPPEHGEPVG